MTKSERQWWIRRLVKLYDEAKARHGGDSLPIYYEVSQMLDYLEETDGLPEDVSLAESCDNLAGRLHVA